MKTIIPITQALEPDEQQRALVAYQLLTKHIEVLRTGLGLRKEHFEKAAAECQQSFEAGAENNLITNNGFGHMAKMFTEEAARSQRVQDELLAWEYGSDDEDATS